MPRFVILEHDQPRLHWDLMLETGSVLRSWRLEKPPACGERIVALALFDHRPIYLNYEGPIQGDRGRVIRWDNGTFTGDGTNEKEIVVYLTGERLRGLLCLLHGNGDDWNGTFCPDRAFAERSFHDQPEIR